MKILVSGGCKNGKSTAAEDMTIRLSENGKRYYIATMIPYDDEDRARIRKHIENRAGKGFTTIECGTDIGDIPEADEKGAAFLVDSTTALLLNEMFKCTGGADYNPEGPANALRGLLKLAERASHVVFVSDYLYSDAALYDDFTENYRKGLGMIDRTLAGISDTVIEFSVGNCIVHKGELP